MTDKPEDVTDKDELLIWLDEALKVIIKLAQSPAGRKLKAVQLIWTAIDYVLIAIRKEKRVDEEEKGGSIG